MSVFVIPRTYEIHQALLNSNFQYTPIYKEQPPSYLIQIYISPEGNLTKEAHDTRLAPEMDAEHFYEILTYMTILETNIFDSWLCDYLLELKRLKSGYRRMF